MIRRFLRFLCEVQRDQKSLVVKILPQELIEDGTRPTRSKVPWGEGCLDLRWFYYG